MTSRNKREGRFLGYTGRYCWAPKGKRVWVRYYCRGVEGIAHLALMKHDAFDILIKRFR